jgi:hypothetical protein
MGKDQVELGKNPSDGLIFSVLASPAGVLIDSSIQAAL